MTGPDEQRTSSITKPSSSQGQRIPHSAQAGSQSNLAEAYPVELRLLLLLCRRPFSLSDVEPAAILCAEVRDWARFMQLAEHHRVLPLITKNAAEHALPPQVSAHLRSYASANALEAFRWLNETRRLLALLAEAGIDATVLKGVPLSLQAFGEIATRDVGDIDLLIEPGEAEAADTVLQTHGWIRKDPAGKLTPRRRASYARHFKDYTYEPMTMDTAGGFEVDLHWRLFRNPHMPGNQLPAADRVDIPIGSLQLRTLSPDTHLLYLAVQGAADGWTRFKAVADFAALWNACSEPQRLLAQANDAGVMPYLSAALVLVEHWIGGIALPEPAQSPLTRSIVANAEQRMKTADFLPELRATSSWALKRHEASLHASIAYQSAILRRVLFRPRTWSRFDLPDALFPLYPLLSPIEWLLFHLGGGREQS